MNEKFLNKVVDQIVRETEIDYVNREVSAPFFYTFYTSLSYLSLYRAYTPFRYHCIEIYGLNKEESVYVYERWEDIVIDEIETNGL